jgi:hypothetical protein
MFLGKYVLHMSSLLLRKLDTSPEERCDPPVRVSWQMPINISQTLQQNFAGEFANKVLHPAQ